MTIWADQSADIVIVGNGLVAMMIGWELKRRDQDLKVKVIGPRSREGGASVVAGAMLSSIGETTKYTFLTEAGRSKFELGERSLARWPNVFDELGLRPSAPGTHVILNAQSGLLDDENYSALITAIQARPSKGYEVDPSSIPGLNPVPTARPLRAVYLQDEPAIEGGVLLDAIAARFSRLGGTTVDSVVSSLVVSDERAVGVQLTDGTIFHAGTTIVAAGAFSQPLLEEALGLGTTVPIVAGVGTAFSARRVLGSGFETVVRTVNRAGSCGLHVVPLGGGREYVGATNVIFRHPETQAGVGMSNFLSTCAMEQLDRDLFFNRIEDWKVGNRPLPLDTFPLLGPGPVGSLYIAAGNYRDGFSASPEIADHIATLILDGTETFAHPFSPMRRPIFPGTAEEAIDEFVRQCISGAFEGAASLPGYIAIEALDPYFRGKAVDVYETLGRDDGLPPDLLHFLAVNRRSDDDLTWFKRALGGNS